MKEGENKDDDKKDKETKKNKEDSSKIKVEDLKLPSKIINILVFNKIKTLGGLIKKEEGDLRAIDGLGDKGIKEIRKAIGYFGSTLK